MDKLFIIMPAYNEEATIGPVVRAWHRCAELAGGDSRLLVIDDGSRDRTSAVLAGLAKELPRLVAVRRANAGHGAAVRYGYRYVLEQGADYIFQTDSDGQTSPAEFGAFWEARTSTDALIGLRRGRKDGFPRVVVTAVLKVVVLLFFRVFARDPNTPFRLMKRKALADVLRFVPDGYDLTNIAVTAALLKRGYRVTWRPISFGKRQGGKNSINLRRIAVIGGRALKDFARINRAIESAAKNETGG